MLLIRLRKVDMMLQFMEIDAFVKQGKNYVQLSGKDKTTFLETGNVPDVKTTTVKTYWSYKKMQPLEKLIQLQVKLYVKPDLVGTKKYLREWVRR